MTFLLLVSLLTLPFLAQIRVADAGCGCCCCCPSCCCKPIIIKLPPPPVKLCPCCCGCGCCCCKPCCCCCCKPCCCCCCKPCCCCCPCCCCGGGGGGRKRRSVVDLMGRKFSDVLLPQQDAMMGMNGGCAGGAGQGVSLSPLHALCSQIPPAQRGPACQQLTQQQFPLSQNIFNHQQGTMAGDFDCPNCANCPSGNCQGCVGGAQGPGGCPNCVGGQHCNGAMCAGAGAASGAFHPAMGAGADGDNTFNLAQNFGAPCGGGNGGGRRKRRAALFLRSTALQQQKAFDEASLLPKGVNGAESRTAAKREVKNQLVFRNNLEFVLRQSPPIGPAANL